MQHKYEVLVYTEEYLLFDFQRFLNTKYNKNEDHTYWHKCFEKNNITSYADLKQFYSF